MTLSEFQAWALAAKSVGKYDDGGYVGQCVSLFNQYCYRVLGVPAGAWGNAKDWATNPAVDQYFDKVSTPQPGDGLIYGSNFGAGDGHIGVYLGDNQMLDQNSDGKGTVKTHQVFPGWIAIIRVKGSNMSNVTISQAEYNDLKNWKATATDPNNVVVAKAVLTDAQNWKNHAINDLQPQIAELQSQLDQDATAKKLDQIKQIVNS